MMSGGTTSGRVESSWPNLTNVGPSSSSISRRCRPRAVPSTARVAGLAARRPRSRSRAGPRPGRSRSGDRGCAASAASATAQCCSWRGRLTSPVRALRDRLDRRLPGALRRLDVDRLADLAAEQRRAERRRRRHGAVAADGADLDGHRLAVRPRSRRPSRCRPRPSRRPATISARSSRERSVRMRASSRPCSFFAAWYSKFSERSPNSRAVLIACDDVVAARAFELGELVAQRLGLLLRSAARRLPLRATSPAPRRVDERGLRHLHARLLEPLDVTLQPRDAARRPPAARAARA